MLNTILSTAMFQETGFETLENVLPGFLGTIFAAMMALALIGFIVMVILYVYIALVMQTIAKKLNYKKAWLAWIPVVNMFLIPILAKKHWAWGFIFFVPIVGLVFYFIWTWHIFVSRKYAGWLSLIPLASIIPIIGFLAPLAYLVVIGLVAWSDRK